MDLNKVIVNVFLITTVKSLTTDLVNKSNFNNSNLELDKINITIVSDNNVDKKLNDVFKGVYTDCVLKFSYSCLQKKTLLYLEELNSMSEVSFIGDYVKFVKVNRTEREDYGKSRNLTLISDADTEELAVLIDKAIERFFKNHIIKFSALGREITMPKNVEEFVGRKKRKGGGGGGHGGDDGGKKKMMMMAMMCMKMKLMMMIPAMMGMMGMMSFKGMMFSMMSFMMSKMTLLMKLLEKKGSAGFGGGSVGGDGGWAAAGGGGGAWMPAGGQDFAGGGYDANAQWQSRSIFEKLESKVKEPIITYVIPPVRYVNKDKKLTIDEVRKPINYGKPKRRKRDIDTMINILDKNKVLNDSTIKYNRSESATKYTRNEFNKTNNIIYSKLCGILTEIIKQHLWRIPKNNNSNTTKELNTNNNIRQAFDKDENTTTEGSSNDNMRTKSRSKRGILDILQNSYLYWINKLLGVGNNRRTYINPKYKIINGLKYVYYPLRPVLKAKTPKETQTSNKMKAVDEGFMPIITAEDFNKGEIVEVAESRMNKKKFNKMKNTVNDTMDDNPWE